MEPGRSPDGALPNGEHKGVTTVRCAGRTLRQNQVIGSGQLNSRFLELLDVFFFLPRNSLKPLTHSVGKAVFFFFQAREKKTAFLHTHSIFRQKWQNTNYYQKQKTITLDE